MTGTRSWRLQARRTRRKLLSSVAITALLASGGIVVATLAPAQSASAATLGPIQTSFEIDGDTAGANDWQGVIGSTPKPPYITASGDQSTGIIDAQRTWDNGTTQGSPGVCGANLGIDDIFVPSTSLNDPTWPTTVGTANDKGDACTGGSAYEVVTDDGVQHTIFYAYWTRYSGSGDMTSYELFEGPADGRADDYLIEFNYNSGGGGSTSVNVLGWDGNSWEPTGATIVYQAAVGTNTDTNTTGNAATFGELAIDLTASGLLPSSGACRSFLDAGFITKTGEGGPATLKDILIADDPITLSNCGGLVVEKVSNPADATSGDVFDYTVTRTGGGVVHDGTLTGPVLPQANNNAIAAPIGVGDTHTWGNVFAGNDYQLAETIDAGEPWVRQSTVCTVTNPSTNLVETYTDQPFKLYVGAQTTCVITNATSGVTVTKQAQGDAATFDFTLSGDNQVGLTAGQTSQTFGYVPGTVVTITELAEVATPAWHLQSIVCNGGTPVINLANGTATITTVAGTVINCTYTNRQDAEIMIVKNVAGADGTFDFSGNWGQDSGDFDLATVGGTANTTYTNVTPGTYTVSEETPEPAYDLTGLTCVDDVQGGGASSADVATGIGTIVLDPGELVVCTFTNTQRGTIIVDKVTDPSGSPVSFDFMLTGPETAAGFALTDAAQPFNSGLRPAGAYSLAETFPAGWELTNINCGPAGSSATSPIAFTLLPGATVICTVLNTAVTGEVSVTKHVEGVPDDYDWSFPISITPVPVGQLGTQNVTDDDPTVSWTELEVGVEYTLIEPDVDGWVSGAFDCEGLVDGDDQVDGFQFTVTPALELSCSITNTVEPGDVEVTKSVSGIADDASWSFDITIDPVPDGQDATQAVTDEEPTVAWTDLEVGTVYTLVEELPAGWEGGEIVCAGLIDLDDQLDGFQFIGMPGLSLDCTVENRAMPGEAVVTKTSIGEDGSFDFVLTPEGGDPIEQTIETVGGTGTTTFGSLEPGVTYTLEEADPGSHWIVGDLECSVTHADDTTEPLDPAGFTVEPGDAIKCAIENTAKGTIVIVKNVEGADGTFDFTGTWPGSGAFGITTVGGNGSDTSTDVPAGVYSVTEMLTNQYVGQLISCTDSAPNGAASSISGLVGTIRLDPGETVVCTYSNTERGEIIVDKVVTGGPDQSFDFELAGDGLDVDFSLTDSDDPFESGLLDPGETYTVEELATADWTLDSLFCVGGADVAYEGAVATIDLNPGEVVYCTYTNSPNPGGVTVEKIVEDVPADWDFSFDITISPVVGGQPATRAVTDEDPIVEWTDLVVGETYTLTETPIDGWTEGPIVCEGIVDENPALAGFQFEVTPGLALECSVTNVAEPGSVEVTKIVEGPIGDVPWSFDVTISPVPAAQSGTQAVTNLDPTVGWNQLVVGTVYTLTEALPAGWTGGVFTCAGLQDLSGDPGYQFMATPGLELDCTVENEVPPATGLIDKEVSSIAQRSDGTWDITYTVTVTNQSIVLPLVYDLDDSPMFGSGVEINTATATGPAGSLVADWDPEGGNDVLAVDQVLAPAGEDVYTISINATVPAVVFDTGQDACSPEDELEDGGFRNTAFLVVGDGEPQPATDCAEPGRAVIEKDLIGTPENLGLGDWEVTYEVVVTSESDLPLFYDLEDDLGFPAGVTIVSAEATNDAGVDTSAWDGEAVTVLADDEVIAPLDVHTFTITVVANVVNITELDTVNCVASTSGNGFFNEATLLNGTVTTVVDDCATIPVGRIQLLKTVDNSALAAILDEIDLGGVTPGSLALLEPVDWNLIGDNAPKATQLVVSGAEGLVFTVPTGDYSLAEVITAAKATYPLLAYYFAGDWMCGLDGGPRSVVPDVGTVELGHLTSCALENVAESVDVSLEKAYELAEGETSVEAGDEFDYVLTVRNNGTLAVPDLDVTDVIDAQLEVTGPATFDGDGTWTEEVVVGDNEFAAHGVGPFEPGAVTTITIPVRMLQPAPVVAPEVVGPNDPPPVIPPVNLADIPNEACVAITPAEGGLQDLISTNNCDEVELPQRAIDSGAYPRCVNDVPYLYYDIQVSDSVEPGPITVTWTSADGTLTEVYEIPWEERNGRLLWPGAAVDENGIPYQFPGWRPITEQDLITPPTPGTRFLDLILDETVPTYPWRDMVNPATVTFSVNPSQEVLVTYPQALPTCAIVRPPELDIEKTASVASTVPGGDYEYTLSITSVGTGAADPVEVFDTIPANLRVDSITTDPAPAFPRWENCEVTGQGSGGYGGVLHCDLLGVLGPNLTTAPDIVLGVHVNPSSTSTLITNTGEVCWSDADVVDDPVVECAEDSVDVKVIVAAVATTGVDTVPLLWGGAGLLVIGAMLVAGMMIRRRRAGEYTP